MKCVFFPIESLIDYSVRRSFLFFTFHKQCAPIAHGAIPQTGQLERLELATRQALAAYEARERIDKVSQRPRVAAGRARRAHQVHWIEVRERRGNLRLRRVVLVQLRTLHNLQLHRAVGRHRPERAAARVRLALDHATAAQCDEANWIFRRSVLFLTLLPSPFFLLIMLTHILGAVD